MTSCKREVLVLWRHIRHIRLFLHAQIGTKLIFTCKYFIVDHHMHAHLSDVKFLTNCSDDFFATYLYMFRNCVVGKWVNVIMSHLLMMLANLTKMLLHAIINYGPVWLDQNQIWILKSGSWNHGVVNTHNIKSESGFLKTNAKSGSSFYPDVGIYHIYPYEFYQNVIVLSPQLFIVKLWTVNCLNKFLKFPWTLSHHRPPSWI